MSEVKSETQQASEKLMAAFGQEIRDFPGEPSWETRRLRANLILEECLETIRALGCDVGWSHIHQEPHIKRGSQGFDLIETIDGCCDINYVVAGTMSAIGVPDLPAQREVNQSNESKMLEDGTLPPHPTVEGKFGKAPGFVPPQLTKVLKELGYE